MDWNPNPSFTDITIHVRRFEMSVCSSLYAKCIYSTLNAKKIPECASFRMQRRTQQPYPTRRYRKPIDTFIGSEASVAALETEIAHLRKENALLYESMLSLSQLRERLDEAIHMNESLHEEIQRIKEDSFAHSPIRANTVFDCGSGHLEISTPPPIYMSPLTDPLSGDWLMRGLSS